jgi:hypothetical protein
MHRPRRECSCGPFLALLNARADALGDTLIGVAGFRRMLKLGQRELRRPHDLRLYQMQDYLDRW